MNLIFGDTQPSLSGVQVDVCEVTYLSLLCFCSVHLRLGSMGCVLFLWLVIFLLVIP